MLGLAKLTHGQTTDLMVIDTSVEDTNDVEWEHSLTFGGLQDLDGNGAVDIDFTGFHCEFNYNSFPLRVHCDSTIKVGLTDKVDIEMAVDMGAQIRLEQLNGMDEEPELDIYFSFDSPEVKWDGQTYIESERFPENGYYLQTIPLETGPVDIGTNQNGFFVEVCATSLREYIPNTSAELAVINVVLDSLKNSGSDFCVEVEVVKTGDKSVDLSLEGTVIALEDSRIDWEEFDAENPTLAFAYSTFVPPLCFDWTDPFDNPCTSSQGAFNFLRDRITGLTSGYVQKFNIADMIEEWVEDMEEIWDERSDDEKTGDEYDEFVKTQKIIRGSQNGAFHLGEDDASNTGIIVASVLAGLAVVALLLWMGFSKRKHGTLFHLPCSTCPCKGKGDKKDLPRFKPEKAEAPKKGNTKSKAKMFEATNI